MKRDLIYVVLGTMLLIGSFTFVSNGWTDERDVLSFVSTTDEDRPIILMNTQGEVLQKLRTKPEHLLDFTWSPDRRSIAYEACQNTICQIHLMEISTNMRRHAHRQLTFNGDKNEWPAWSPNGKWIAFTSDRAGDRNIYKMDVDGENVIRLTKERKCYEPVWSPDSRWIAFVSHHDATLFVMDAEGKNVRHLGKRGEVLFKCTWSPDGKQIAFISADIEDGIVYTIDVIDVDGQNMRQLTKSEEGTVIRELAWSSSGKWIAYILTQPKGHIAQLFANGVVRIVDTAEGGQSEAIEATKGIGARYLSWVPTGLLSVSPSAEKQIILWSKLKQTNK